MNISKQDIIQIENTKYIVLTSTNYLNVEYFLVNELDEKEEPTQSYYIFYKDNQELKVMKDGEIFCYLVPIFQQELKKEISNLWKKIIN